VDDLTSYFIAETRESLEQIGSALVAWEADPSQTARLDDIFRFVHTVKGSCGFLDLVRIEALAHAAETVLSTYRDGTAHADRRSVTAILAIIDRIAMLTELLETDGEFPPVNSDHALIAAIAGDAHAVQPVVDVATVPRPSRNVRIAVDLIDTLMNQVSDLVLSRNELARTLRTERGDSAAEAMLEQLSSRVADLRDSVALARMQPVERLFSALPRLVRDTSGLLGKSVSLVMTGSDVELDREMVEQLRDPLIHIVRNAIDHGIEAPADRILAGKSATSCLSVTARQNGNQVTIEISDDGCGIDIDRLREKAIQANVIDARRAATLSDNEIAQFIFAPGVSTANEVTAISGRGVGMDVVRANVERLGGAILLRNRPGAGLTVELRSPLTLSIITVLAVTAGDQRFALPRATVDEVVAIGAATVDVENLGQGRVVTLRGETLSVVSLGQVLNAHASDPSHLVIIDSGSGQRWALAVDSVCDLEEVVVRPASPMTAATGVFAGQTLPDVGGPMLLLDTLGLLRRAEISGEQHRSQKETVAVITDVALLTFAGLDGQFRTVRALQVDGIEYVSVDLFSRIGAKTVVALHGTFEHAVVQGPLPTSGDVPMIRLLDGDTLYAYPVAQVHDLVRIATSDIFSNVDGSVALIDGKPVPVVDAQERAPHAVSEQPVVTVSGGDPHWIDSILSPLITAAGYQLETTGTGDAAPTITIADAKASPVKRKRAAR
jgi:two-component system, chemotaxis family, sensor kinase CheA